MHLHQFTILGRIGKITKLNKVAKVSVASTQSYFDKKANERKYEPRWNTVTIFDEGTIKFLDKCQSGDLVQVVGEVYEDRYEKAGETVYTTVLRASGFTRLARKAEQSDDEAA